MFHILFIFCTFQSAHLQYGTVSPLHQVVYEGDTTDIACNSVIKAKWTKDNSPLTGDFSLVNNKLILHHVTEAQSGMYMCEGVKEGNQEFTAISELLVGEKSVNGIDPLTELVKIGSLAKFTCLSDGKSQWYHEEMHRHPISPPKSHNRRISIHAIDYDRSGYYYCYGFNQGRNKNFLAKAELRVYDPIRIQPPYAKKREGATIEFNCHSYDPIVFWYFNKDYSQAYHVGRTFKISKISVLNHGYYECVGSDQKGKKFRSVAILDVLVTDNDYINPKHQTVAIGESVKILCKAEDLIKWSFSGGMMPSNVVTNGHENLNNYHTLKIVEANRENEGTYTCHGRSIGIYKDRLMFFEANGEIYVESHGDLSPRKHVAEKGDTIEFECESDTWPYWSFQKSFVPMRSVDYEVRKTNRFRLRLCNVSAEHHDGEYTCSGILGGNRFRSFGYVKVLDKDKSNSAQPSLADDMSETCPPLSLQNGRILYQNDDDIGALAVHKCSHGYKLVGKLQRKCLSNRRWSDQDSMCVRTSYIPSHYMNITLLIMITLFSILLLM